MPYPLDRLTNASQPVTIAGKSYPVKQLTLAEWGELQAWLKTVCPSPVAVAAKALAELQAQGTILPQLVQDALFRQAQEESRRWPPKVGTLAWLRAIEDIEDGRGRFLQAALGAGGTMLDQAQADAIVEQATLDELGDLMRVCLHGEHLAPKDSSPTIPVSTPTNGDGSSGEFSNSSQLGRSEIWAG